MADDYTMVPSESVRTEDGNGIAGDGNGVMGSDGITSFGTTQLYNTVSCPCSSAAVTLAGGRIICERDHFGKKQHIHPISINNHFISNKPPKVGDR